jgi:hypothetical protein
LGILLPRARRNVSRSKAITPEQGDELLGDELGEATNRRLVEPEGALGPIFEGPIARALTAHEKTLLQEATRRLGRRYGGWWHP